MKLVVGLGNPGERYERTRHNVGFRVIDELARRWEIAVKRRKFGGKIGGGRIADQRVLLLEPMTYMNRSGRTVREAVTFHKLKPADLLVVADDLALPLGRLRLRPQGSAGGHNGLADIIAELGGSGFARLRVGIESVAGASMVRHVLSPFSAQEEREMVQAIRRAADAVECWMRDGVDTAMNTYNRPPEPEDEPGTDRQDGPRTQPGGGSQP